MKPTELIERLEHVRSRTRTWIAAEHLARLVVGVIIAFLAAAIIDWWVHFPPALRAAATGVTLFAALRRLLQHVVRSLRQPVSLQEVAILVDNRHPELGNRLATAVEHLQSPHSAAAAQQSAATQQFASAPRNILWERVVGQALSAADRVPWTRLVRTQRPLVTILTGVVALLSLASITTAWPELATVGVPRYVWPFGPAEWRRRVEISPLTGDMTVAAGEQAVVEMRIVRGASRRLRAYVAWTPQNGTTRREMMVPGEDGLFIWTHPSLRDTAVYWFEAGDDSTSDRPARVRVVERPALTSATLRATPPPYAVALGESTQPLPESRAVVLQGSRCILEVALSKPVGRDERGQPQIQLVASDGTTPPVRPADDAGRMWQIELAVESAMTFTFHVTDLEGFELSSSPTFQIDVRHDELPRVAITWPGQTLEVTPTAEIDLRIVAHDDIALSDVGLAARIAQDELPFLPLWSAHPAAADAPVIHDRKIELDAVWPLADFRLAPGTIVEYWAQAQDNYERDALRHPPGRSAVLRLRVISQAEFGERIRDEFLSVGRQVQQLAAEQEAVRNQTQDLPAGEAADGRRAAVDAAISRQQAVARGTAATAERLRSLGDRIEQNRHADPSAVAKASDLAEQLADIRAGEMNDAHQGLRSLQSAAATAPAEVQQAAVKAQDDAIEGLRQVLAKLAQFNDVGDVAQTARDLLDRQEEIARQTSAVTGDLAGRDASTLNAAEQQRLDNLARREDDLGRQLAEMLAKIGPLAEQIAERERAAADAMKRAHDAAEKAGVADHIREAAEAIRQNQGNRAEGAQAAAAEGIRSMIESLNERSQRELEELSKELSEVAERLEKLIQRQEQLVADTQTAAKAGDASAALTGLAPRQQTLKGTAARLAEQIDSTAEKDSGGRDDYRSAAGSVRSASAEMEDAARQLSGADAPAATAKQIAAIDLLKQAAESLASAQEHADREIAQQMLEEIRTELTELLAGQSAIIVPTDEIVTRTKSAGRLTRVDGVKLTNLSRDQAKLTERLAAVQKRMGNAVVYDFVCEQVLDHMRTAETHLRDRRPDEALAAERAAADGLRELLDALHEPLLQNRRQYADERAGGAGAASQGGRRDRPIPALAELKVLRALQARLNETVAAFDARVPPLPARTEEELKEAESLGAQQTKLRELANTLIDRATGGQK